MEKYEAIGMVKLSFLEYTSASIPIIVPINAKFFTIKKTNGNEIVMPAKVPIKVLWEYGNFLFPYFLPIKFENVSPIEKTIIAAIPISFLLKRKHEIEIILTAKKYQKILSISLYLIKKKEEMHKKMKKIDK